MDVPLHLQPMSLGEILDRSFRLYRNHFLKFFLTVLLAQSVGFVLLQVYLAKCFIPFYHVLQKIRLLDEGRPDLDGTLFAQAFAGTFLFGVCYALLSLAYLGALIYLVHDTFLGRTLGIGEAYWRTLKRLWPLIRVNVLKINILGLAFLVWLFPMSFAIYARNWWVVGAWILIGSLPFVFGYLWLAMVSIVLMVEERGIWDSLRRSARLMFVLTDKTFLGSNSFRISIVLLTIFVIKRVVEMVSQTPFAAWKIFEVFRDPGMLTQYHRGALDSVFELLNMVMQSATAPFALAALVLFYLDIRIRKEGLDLSLRLRALRERLPDPRLQKA